MLEALYLNHTHTRTHIHMHARTHTHTHTQHVERVSLLKVRLVPPQSGLDFLGRLEVLHNGVWGTVCDNGFGSTEASVVCGMLNYTQTLCSVPNARLGQGRGMLCG